jgi:D-3-phosphoglycerate dehydrogenase
MQTAIITDHNFPSLEPQRTVLESAGFHLRAAEPSCRTEEDIIERCGDGDVLLVQWAPVTRRVLSAMPRVRCIVRYGVGVNNFDLDAARELGVTAANVPDYCVEEVSDHAIAMILALGRRIPQDDAQIRRGDWGIAKYLPLPAFRSLTLGLLGFGAIGRRVAEKIRCFGFRIIASDPHVADSVFREHAVEPVNWDRLLETADILSLHTPLLPGTKHIINRHSIERMRPGALLINTSRGPLVKEQDLIEALRQGRLAGAGLDVFEVEPLPPNSPLRELHNVILTSHAASVSDKASLQLQIKAAEAARDFLLGQRPRFTLGNGV